ncbi:HD domain-containing protein [Brachyspira hampsonii]|uniref:HDIG domain-containing protein n=1 Tax=Brachyspira hampsonii 30446 TaxID=1289135 RepID=A0A2U4FM36_9SPIR|nr:HD domain-containing protein [Brachyspira hampsonii]EKV56153.1 HDIG domain-containing protein [Brachyspira hampsonii 30446]MBW5389467.1 HD domain-containing protein [Brachyspira hampsonii]MBW5393952.1 HD domain-containing protein [Brachyspira hampsonii]OEJ18870.1 hydrolase [Brachyspira hampsonii]
MASIERDKAIELFKKYNNEHSLFKHALSVEAVMRYFARKNAEDEDEWGMVGFLHDMDYEKYPDEHCIKVREILEAEGLPDSFIRAIQSHGYGICTDIEPLSNMEKTLYAVDELAGFITACALVRPSKSLDDMEVKSVKKKLKDKAFAAKVDRAVINKGSEMLGINIDELIKETIEALIPVQENIGLNKIS